MTNKWNYLPLTSEQELISKTLEERYPQCPTICKLLAQRGVTSPEETEKFFKPLMSDLHDPFLMKDMQKAVDRLNAAIGANCGTCSATDACFGVCHKGKMIASNILNRSYLPLKQSVNCFRNRLLFI